ncbi:MAG: right-handed parallel beta-helix repeat-containing protein [Kiritimatiellae bacterium]|nr:right-handed parallel beta-helix repeat-containing protein [Kiritimatiellia bacterium]
MIRRTAFVLSAAGAWGLGVAGVGGAEYAVQPGQSVAATAKQLKPGDALLLRAGLYRESIELGGLRGNAANPIVIRGERGSVNGRRQKTGEADPVRQPGGDVFLPVIIEPGGRDGILLYGGCAHVRIETLQVRRASRAGIVVNGSQDITVRDCVVTDSGTWGIQTCLCDRIAVEACRVQGTRREHGVYFSTTDHPVVRRCTIRDNAGCGIHLNGDRHEGGDGMITGALLEWNVVSGNGRAGGAAINMDGVERAIVRGNLVYGNHAGGIVTFRHDGVRFGAQNVFSNNTVRFGAGRGRFGLYLAGGANHTVTHNILVCGAGPAFRVAAESVAGLKSENNVFFAPGSHAAIRLGWRNRTLRDWQARTGNDAVSVAADPLFVAADKADFRLQLDSPALAQHAGWRQEAHP